MNTTSICAASLALLGLRLFAQAPSSATSPQLPSYIDRPADAAGVFAIWPGSGIPPGSENATGHEQTTQAGPSGTQNRMVRNVVIPTVTMYKPTAGAPEGTALIVAPGGGFRFLMVDYEGIDMAHWLVQRGITAFVLKYRVAHTPENDADLPTFLERFHKDLARIDLKSPNPPKVDPEGEAARNLAEEDGRQAIRFVRRHAAEWSIDPNRIGIAGFSAGGGVVMGAVMQHDAQSRPDFAAPIYPAYRTAMPVPADAPPLFIALADDDQLVPPISGTRLYEAWHAAGKSAELHVFSKGKHGFGMKKLNLPSDEWIDLFENWLRAEGYLALPGK
jgi:acetyl esterase/lipase